MGNITPCDGIVKLTLNSLNGTPLRVFTIPLTTTCWGKSGPIFVNLTMPYFRVSVADIDCGSSLHTAKHHKSFSVDFFTIEDSEVSINWASGLHPVRWTPT